MVVTEADPAKEATAAWLRSQWRRYYASTKRILPDRFGRREFGFMFFNSTMVIRHIGFSREQELNEFLVDKIPAHAYYSSAYYETPGAKTMEEKGWLGADLIFDLDADHLPNAKFMTYPEMLEAIRLRIIKLYDDFLRSDFGFEESKMRLVFSGGRGYHIHVFDERVWSLGSHERREIVDWVTGKGLDAGSVFKESVFDTKEFGGKKYSKKKVTMANPKTATGWPGKIARGFETLALKLLELTEDQGIQFLTTFEGVSNKDARDLWANLFQNRAIPPKVIRGIDVWLKTGQIEALSDRNVKLVVKIITQMEQVRLEERGGVSLQDVNPFGDTDEPVTSDIKRLIRLPSSLHGKTGLRVIPLTRDQVDDFRPLRDAVPDTWTDEPVSMRFANNINLEINGEAFNVAPGVNAVPQFLAIFAAARGLATVNPEA